MGKAYYIRVQGRVQGPLTLERIQLLIKRRQFGRLHEASEDGRVWVPASEVPDLFREPPELKIRPRAVAQVQPENAGSPLEEPCGFDNPSDAPAFAHDRETERPAVLDGWFYLEADNNVGPVAIGEIQQRLKTGTLAPDVWVWHATLSDWLPAHRVPEFAVALTGAPSLSQIPAPSAIAELDQLISSDRQMPEASLSWWDQQFSKFGLLAMVLLPLFCNGPALILGITGLIVCRNSRARENAKWIVIFSAVVTAFGILMTAFLLFNMPGVPRRH